jgi:hypothetical protein
MLYQSSYRFLVFIKLSDLNKVDSFFCIFNFFSCSSSSSSFDLKSFFIFVCSAKVIFLNMLNYSSSFSNFSSNSLFISSLSLISFLKFVSTIFLPTSSSSYILASPFKKFYLSFCSFSFLIISSFSLIIFLSSSISFFALSFS